MKKTVLATLASIALTSVSSVAFAQGNVPPKPPLVKPALPPKAVTPALPPKPVTQNAPPIEKQPKPKKETDAQLKRKLDEHEPLTGAELRRLTTQKTSEHGKPAGIRPGALTDGQLNVLLKEGKTLTPAQLRSLTDAQLSTLTDGQVKQIRDMPAPKDKPGARTAPGTVRPPGFYVNDDPMRHRAK
jgi:hypothetical protein